jgi:uncharacterized protein (TIGR03435 family)
MSSIAFSSGGRLNATQATLRDLILRAYGLNDFQLTGGPRWMAVDRFDVAAQAESGFQGGSAQVQAMLRELLAERFALRARLETRDLPILELHAARRDGRLGPQLRPSNMDCAAIRAKRPAGVAAGPGEPTCVPSFDMDAKANVLTIRLEGESIAELARVLSSSPEIRRIIRDATGLAGTFDVELSFTPEPLPGFPRLPNGENGFSLLAAIREQLGLRPESAQGPVEVLVVESADQPSEN